jgi:hypothetical protein
MNRQDMIDKLCFRREGMWLTGKVPRLFVTVGGKPDDYTDDELALLVPFTEAKQADYHRRCGNSKMDWADNFISFERAVEDSHGLVRWGRKRQSWVMGRMHSPSLPEAISSFWDDNYRHETLGQVCLLSSGDIVVIVGKVPYEEQAALGGEYLSRSLVTGDDVVFKRHVKAVTIASTGIEALGDQMRMAMRHRQKSRPGADPVWIARSEDAYTDSNNPKALVEMWADRVLSFDESEREAIAA